MARRKRETVGPFKNSLLLPTVDFDGILKQAEVDVAPARQAEMTALGLAFARFRSHRRARQLKVKPNELREHLKQIEKASATLAKLLDTKREAADLMMRVTFPEHDIAKLLVSPTAPPVFAQRAVEMQMAARNALANLSKDLPYVDKHRGNVELDQLIAELIEIWQTCIGAAPTFSSGNPDALSPFVRFAFACCGYLKWSATPSGLAKRGQRIYAARLGPKASKNRPSRGPTKHATGHVVRKGRGEISRDRRTR